MLFRSPALNQNIIVAYQRQGKVDDAFAERFTAAMDSRGLHLAQSLAKACAPELASSARLLDVGGGSGVYSCVLCAFQPNLRAAILEKPPVDRLAARAVSKRGLSARIETSALNMFESPWPKDCDLHLISNVLHDWDAPDVKRLLTKSHDALPAGGHLMIHDMHLNDAKDGPFAVAAYSALLMQITEGRIYSTREIREWSADIGFDWVDFRTTSAEIGRAHV